MSMALASIGQCRRKELLREDKGHHIYVDVYVVDDIDLLENDICFALLL